MLQQNQKARTSFDTLTNREFLKKETLTTFFTEWHDIPFDNEVKNKRETNSIVKKQVEKLQDKIFARPYVIDVEVLIQNKSIHKYTNIPMSEIRMRKSGSLNIDGYEPQPWDKKTDKCVYDYITHTYGNIRGFKKVCNYNTISEVSGDDECYTSGVNSWNIRVWCVEYNVPTRQVSSRSAQGGRRHTFCSALARQGARRCRRQRFGGATRRTWPAASSIAEHCSRTSSTPAPGS